MMSNFVDKFYLDPFKFLDNSFQNYVNFLGHHIYTYICIYKIIYIYIHTHTHIYIYIHTHTHTHIYIYIYI